MANQPARRGEPGRHLRLTGRAARPGARIVARPEAQVPSEVDPLFAVAVRAFLLDVGILGTSVGRLHLGR